MLPLSYSSLDVTLAKAMIFSKFLGGLPKVGGDFYRFLRDFSGAKFDFANAMWQNPEFIAVSLKP
jgi:hypothetical protein